MSEASKSNPLEAIQRAPWPFLQQSKQGKTKPSRAANNTKRRSKPSLKEKKLIPNKANNTTMDYRAF